MENFKTVAHTLPGETVHFGFCLPKIGFFSLESSSLCYLGAQAKFQNCSTNPSGRNSPFRLFSAKNRLLGGAWGGPRNFIFIGILICYYLGAPAKFQICSTNPSGRNGPFWLFPAPNWLFWRARGGPRNFFPLESYHFCELGAHAKFQNCSTNPSGRNGPFWLLSAPNRLF